MHLQKENISYSNRVWQELLPRVLFSIFATFFMLFVFQSLDGFVLLALLVIFWINTIRSSFTWAKYHMLDIRIDQQQVQIQYLEKDKLLTFQAPRTAISAKLILRGWSPFRAEHKKVLGLRIIHTDGTNILKQNQTKLWSSQALHELFYDGFQNYQ